jgi:hypothetical protein
MRSKGKYNFQDQQLIDFGLTSQLGLGKNRLGELEHLILYKEF